MPNADAVAIQDANRSTILRVPQSDGPDHWIPTTRIALQRQLVRPPADDGERCICCEIPLRSSASSSLVGRLVIRLKSTETDLREADFAKASTPINCIARQLAISSDLALVRLASEQNQSDMQFLTDLDKLMIGLGARSSLKVLLDQASRYLDCTMAAVLVPRSRIKLFWPVDPPENERQKSSIIGAVGKLYAAARESRKVIISNDAELVGLLETQRGRGAQVLCSPLADPQSRVNGALILVRKVPFSRDDVRLSRALCVKMGGALSMEKNSCEGALDRNSVIERIDSDMNRDPRSNRAFLFVDIDRLHIINDRFGHSVGDNVIQATANTLAETAGSTDVVASLSGDLLGLYLSNADEGRAIRTAERILQKVAAAPIADAHRSMELSVSIGIALAPDHASNGSQAISIAEVACQSAKSRGAGQYVLFRDHDASIMQRHNDLNEIGNLQNALIENRFVLFAQKIQSLDSGEPARKFELLTRMLDPVGSIVPPGKFLSAAARYQMMPALDRWVISHALQQLSDAENMLEINLSCFGINVSGQSLAEEGFSDFVVGSVRDSGLSPDSICFEITEAAAVKSLDLALKFINEVRKIGCSVALDDFGTGYCSFAYLQDIPIDFLKIDGMFVKNIAHDPLSEAIVHAVVGIANVKGAATIAEYVENSSVARKLSALGVNFGQGFGIGRPEPLAEVLDRMESPLDLGLTGTIRIQGAVSAGQVA